MYSCLTGRHTGDSIYAAYTNCLKEFAITNKVMFIITDNASNMRKAFSVRLEPVGTDAAIAPEGDGDDVDDVDGDVDDAELWEDLDETELEVQTVVQGKVRLSCFAHSLQLAVGDGLKVYLSHNEL